MKQCRHPTCEGDECRKKKAPKPRTPIKPRSKKMIKDMKTYNELRDEFLEDNPQCGVCGGIASQVHHKKGRVGKDLLDQKHWLSVCPDCHRWIEEHPEAAKEMGYSENRLTA